MIRLFALLLLLAAPGLSLAQGLDRFLPRETFTSVPAPPLQIYIVVDGQQVGPLDEEGFKGYLGSPEAAAAMLVWMPGMSDWAPASSVPQLQGVIASIGQEDTPGGQFSVPDMQAFMLGVWVSESFVWPLNDVDYNALVQVKLLPDGRFEGATIFWDTSQPDAPLQIWHEKGDWTLAPTEDGRYRLDRNITYAIVSGTEIVESGQTTDGFEVQADGPNSLTSIEGIGFVRVPDAG